MTHTFAAAHKFWSVVIVLVLAYGGYRVYSILTTPPTTTQYVTTTVATSTVVASMTETGQVSASSNVSIQAQSSGAILSLPVAAGEHVTAGTPIAYLDPTTAQQGVTSAQQSLESSNIALAELLTPAATSSITSAQNAVAAAEASLVAAHTSGYNDVSSAFLDLPNIINGLDTTLHGYTVPGRTAQQNEDAYSSIVAEYAPSVVQYRTAAESSFVAAQTAYNKTLADYKATPRDATDAQIEALVQETYNAAADISDALKAATNFLNLVDTTLTNQNFNIPSPLPGQIATLTTYTNTTNNHVAALSADVSNVPSANRTLVEAQASLSELQAGATALSIQSAQLAIQQKELALTQAQQTLANTVVRAPFSGIVAALAVQKYQTISNGTAVATMVSDNQNVDISVNEVDAAKLKVGEKATLTFDALPNVSVGGTVSSVNMLGSVSSGVVSYDAVITFDTPNTQVLPGMSVTANIITGSQTGLVVPQSAVKTVGSQNYVEVFSSANNRSVAGASSVLPTRVPVTTGLSDNSNIVIENGLRAGEEVVTQTIAGSSGTLSNAAQTTAAFGGGRPGGGAIFRALGH
ncbi:MAG TPA: efflux RND transporter periplasmic adaptor subunit [Candidatus Paceibacterota bacterium]|nr:efflux RND transporter periplasmic adaptor subunit [Candidatus Paceibacterota bacterium]